MKNQTISLILSIFLILSGCSTSSHRVTATPNGSVQVEERKVDRSEASSTLLYLIVISILIGTYTASGRSN